MAFICDVKVIPSSGRNEWKIDKTGKLKCYLKNPAEDGKANKELIKTLAKALGIAQDMVSIVSGEQSSQKRIKIDIDMNYNKLLQALGIDWQMDMFS